MTRKLARTTALPDAKAWLRGGMTLVEILTVTAIIALLIAILLPSVSRAMRQTKRTVCKAHEYQMSRSDQCRSAQIRLEAFDCGCYGELGKGLQVFTMPADTPPDEFRRQLEEEVRNACTRSSSKG